MVPTIQARDQKKRINGKLTPIYRGIGLLIDHPELAVPYEEEETPEPSGPVQETLPDSKPSPPAAPPAQRRTELSSAVNKITSTMRITTLTRQRTERDRQ